MGEPEKRVYIVPVTIVEHCRLAAVEAESPKVARMRARYAEWNDIGEAERYTVRVSGKAKLAKPDVVAK